MTTPMPEAESPRNEPESGALAAKPRPSLVVRVLTTRVGTLPRLPFRSRRRRHAPWRALIANAQLPDELAHRVKDVVRRTRLWPRERADVAAELCSHFADGVAAGRSTVELAEKFGEVGEAARLIRRAKRRNRPLWWQAWRLGVRGLGAALLLLAVVYGVLAVRYYTARPTITRDFVAEMNAGIASIPEQQRAWPLYREATLALETPPESWSKVNPMYPEIPTTDARWPEVVAYLERQRGVLSLIREAARRPRLGYGLSKGGDEELARKRGAGAAAAPVEEHADFGVFTIRLDGLTDIRVLARAVIADHHAAVAAGEGARAAEDISTLLAMSEHVAEHPFMISDLIRHAIADYALGALSRTLAQSPDVFTSEELVDLAHRIGAVSGGIGGSRITEQMVESLATERNGFLDALQRIYTDDGRGGGHVTREGIRAFDALLTATGDDGWHDRVGGMAALAPLSVGVTAGRSEILAVYDQMVEQTVTRIRKPGWEQGESPNTDMFVETGLRGSSFARARYWPVSLLTPAFHAYTNTGFRRTGFSDAALTAIGLELFRRRHGAYPASLEDLVPRYLPTVPLDAFTGRPLVYRVVEGRPLLYSVGADLTDDGGTPNTYGNLAAARPMYSASVIQAMSPEQKQGFAGDWVLYPRPPEPAPPPQ